MTLHGMIQVQRCAPQAVIEKADMGPRSLWLALVTYDFAAGSLKMS